MAQPKSTKPTNASSSTSPEKEGPSLALTGCLAQGCKAKGSSFGFCNEHYDHFKFGLITKAGKPVSDYDKKIEHYQAYKARQTARKVA